MGTISRAPGTPLVNGQANDATPVETDFSNLFALVNGNVEAINLADDAVTTGKIADDAVTGEKLADDTVTQDKLVDGAASGSEASATALAQTIASSTYATIGSEAVHVVTTGTPRQVAIFVSFDLENLDSGNRVFMFKIQKDGADLLAAPDESISASASQLVPVTRMWVDTAPSAGATHTYAVQAKRVSGSLRVSNVHIFVLEPRR